MSKRIKLINAVLGMQPFVLIEYGPDPTDDQALSINLQYGGGAANSDQALLMLLHVVGELTETPADDYLEQIDRVRAGKGLPPMTDALASAGDPR